MKFLLSFFCSLTFISCTISSAWACKQTPYTASLADVTSLVKYLADKGEPYFSGQASVHSIYEWSPGVYAVEGRKSKKECKASLFQVDRSPSCERVVAPSMLKIKVNCKAQK